MIHQEIVEEALKQVGLEKDYEVKKFGTNSFIVQEIGLKDPIAIPGAITVDFEEFNDPAPSIQNPTCKMNWTSGSIPVEFKENTVLVGMDGEQFKLEDPDSIFKIGYCICKQLDEHIKMHGRLEDMLKELGEKNNELSSPRE
jgi:hypothetical protein